ncbi:MAG: DNA polymerase III subunit delta [Bdellovibrionales bacterium]
MEKDWQSLMPCLQQPLDSCLLVIEAEKVDRRKKWVKSMGQQVQWVQLKSPYDNQVPQWVQYIAQQNDLQLSSDQIHWLQHVVGHRLVDIRNEIIKLKQFVGSRSQVQQKDLETVISHSRVQTVFELTDAIGDRDQKKALQH